MGLAAFSFATNNNGELPRSYFTTHWYRFPTHVNTSNEVTFGTPWRQWQAQGVTEGLRRCPSSKRPLNE